MTLNLYEYDECKKKLLHRLNMIQKIWLTKRRPSYYYHEYVTSRVQSYINRATRKVYYQSIVMKNKN